MGVRRRDNFFIFLCMYELFLKYLFGLVFLGLFLVGVLLNIWDVKYKFFKNSHGIQMKPQFSSHSSSFTQASIYSNLIKKGKYSWIRHKP